MKTHGNKQIKAIPDGYTAVTPWVISPDTAGLIGFMAAVFGAEEIPNSRITGEDGVIIHAVVKIEDAMVMLFDKRGGWAAAPAFFNIYVPGVESTYEKALGMGAKPVTDITLLWFGEKVCRVLDPFGNLWWINERVEEVDMANTEEVKRRSSTPEAVKGIAYIQQSLNDAMLAQKKFLKDK